MPAPTRRANNVLHHAIRCGIRSIVEEHVAPLRSTATIPAASNRAPMAVQ